MSRSSDFEISFVYESVQSAWRILIISVVRHAILLTLHWYRPTAFDFKIKFLSGFVSGTSRLLIVARSRHGRFGGYPLLQIKGFCKQIAVMIIKYFEIVFEKESWYVFLNLKLIWIGLFWLRFSRTVPQHKRKHVFDFFQCECFFLFLSKKNLSIRWLNQKREENVEKEKKVVK